MRLGKVFIVLLLAVCSGFSVQAANRLDQLYRITLPAGSKLNYRENANAPGYFIFKGQITATGLLAAYWQAEYPVTETETAEPMAAQRSMHLRFYPDAASQEKLPAFVSASGVSNKHTRLFLYRGQQPAEDLNQLNSAYPADDMQAIQQLVADFTELPKPFLSHQEGVALQPVEITLNNLLSFVESDHRFLYAQAEAFSPLSTQEYLLRQIPDSDPDTYLSQPWLEHFYPAAALVVRNNPQSDAAVLSRIPQGSSATIKKIRTVDKQWMQVEVTSGKNNPITGFVEQKHLQPVN